MHGKESLSATNLATHHHLGCDLYLHHTYWGTDPAKTRLTIPSELSKAQFERGNEWESALFSWLDEEGLLLRVFSSALEASEIKDIIQFDERDHFFVAGLSFWPPKEALDAEFAKASTTPVHFGLAKPDLVEIVRDDDGNITWKVIDAKASQEMKTSHLVQIYFYTLCLSLLLPQSFRSSSNAAVWLPPASGFRSASPSLANLKTVDLHLLGDTLKDFLFTKLPTILALPREQVSWHFNPLCRTCSFEPECRSRSTREQTIGSLSNISLDDAAVLESLLVISRGKQDGQHKELLPDIEELHMLFADKPKAVDMEREFPTTLRKSKRILGIPNRRYKDGKIIPSSAKIEAARSHTVKVVNRRNYTFPRAEDIAIILSLVQDPASASRHLAAYTISVFSSVRSMQSYKPVWGTGDDLVPALASLIQRILDLRSEIDGHVPRTQFYVFSQSEHSILQRHLIDTALTLGPLDVRLHFAVRLCIGALSEGASHLSTAFQPLVLSGALLDFLGKKGSRKKAEFQMCLERLGLETEGTVDQLRSRISNEIDRLKRDGGRLASGSSRFELGQLPRVVVMAKEVDRLLALPIPGYWDLPECAALLLPSQQTPKCPTDDDIYLDHKNGKNVQVKNALKIRNWHIYEMIKILRVRVHNSTIGRPNLLVNDARVLSAEFMDICKQEHLRKLFFMQQFEVLAKLTDLWRSRIDGCPDAPVLEYRNSRPSGTPKLTSTEHCFRLISGGLDMPTDKDKDRAFFDYLLVEDFDDEVSGAGGDQSSLPVEALFDDLGVSGLLFPLNRWTKGKWDEQHPLVKGSLLVADLRDMSIEGHETIVALQTWGGYGVKLVAGHKYRLSPRLIDFNLTKILSTLLELDLRISGDLGPSSIPFLQLITNPRSLDFDHDGSSARSKASVNAENTIQSSFRQLHSLGSEAAGALILKSSQQKAARRILSRHLTVIWGPPGTGKTYTIALSMLRMFDVQHRMQSSSCKVVFLTAMTHAAIEACLTKLSHLISRYREIPDLPIAWLDHLNIEHVLRGNDHEAPRTNGYYIYAGTVYQLYNFSKRRSFDVDCVVIDEAGQLSLGSAALVLRSLTSTGRIIVAGDSEQLAPILTAQYPRLKSRLFGSILDCLMDLSNESLDDHDPDTAPVTRSASPTEFSEISPSQMSTIVQLTENFRLNPDLGEFVSTIYSRAFKPQKVQARQVATRLKSLIVEGETDLVLMDIKRFLLALGDVMLRQPQALLQPPRLDTATQDIVPQVTDLTAIPRPISLAMIRLRTTSRRPEQLGYEAHVKGEARVAAALVQSLRKSSPGDDIFVATPHRVQRQAVKAALKSAEEEDLVGAMLGLNIASPPANVGKVTIDTVERLQGSEAGFVICLFSLPATSSSATKSELNFLLERRRLNVAISRAKTLCILVTSDNVLRPSVKTLSDEGSARGYAFLKAFEERAWSYPMKIDLDLV